MHYTDPLTVKGLTVSRADTLRRQAQTRSLLRQVRSREEKGLPHRGYQLLHHMGQQLVVLGEWLEQYSSPQHSY